MNVSLKPRGEVPDPEQRPDSLTEARVIFELAQRPAAEVVDLRRTLDIDPGYLSRILARFETDGFITRERSTVGGRRQVIRLTNRGREVFAMLDARSAEENRKLLSRLTEEDRRRLLGAMGIGSRLVEECLRFARRAGYEQIMLWTNDVLEDARRIYERAGFQLVEEESHHSFGHDLVGQNWWRKL